KGAERCPSFFPERPIEDVDEIVASDGTQASDGNAGFSMNEGEAAIASFHHQGTGVEVKGFDKLYDVVISHDDIVPDRRIVVLRLASPRADSKCRGLIAKSIADNSPRLDSTVAMTCHRSSPSSAAAPILPPIVISLMAPFRSFFTAPVWEHVLVLRRPIFWRNAENDLDVVLIDFDPALHGAN